MSRHRRLVLTLALGAASAVALSGCATPSSPAGAGGSGGSSLGSEWPAPPPGQVVALGTVMDVGGDVELCLGPVAESYPPQCSGIPLVDWSWDEVEGAEASGDVTWGAYAVQGTFDGEEYTVTAPPVMLALYDPMAFPDPTNGEPGAGDEAELLEIQEELPSLLGDAYLSSYPEDGWLKVDVVWDDGTWQAAADADYGEYVVLIRSAMHVLEE
jgi:hypothetical protein